MRDTQTATASTNAEMFRLSLGLWAAMVALPYLALPRVGLGLGDWWVFNLVFYTPPAIAYGVLAGGDLVRRRAGRC